MWLSVASSMSISVLYWGAQKWTQPSKFDCHQCHQCWTGGKSHLLWPACNTLLNVVQDIISFLCQQGILLTHVEVDVHLLQTEAAPQYTSLIREKQEYTCRYNIDIMYWFNSDLLTRFEDCIHSIIYCLEAKVKHTYKCSCWVMRFRVWLAFKIGITEARCGWIHFLFHN